MLHDLAHLGWDRWTGCGVKSIPKANPTTTTQKQVQSFFWGGGGGEEWAKWKWARGVKDDEFHDIRNGWGGVVSNL